MKVKFMFLLLNGIWLMQAMEHKRPRKEEKEKGAESQPSCKKMRKEEEILQEWSQEAQEALHQALCNINENPELDETEILAALEQGADATSWRGLSEQGNPVLWASEAAGEGHTEAIKLLVTYGADTETMSDDGHTLLSRAINHFDYELAEWLLEQGADITNRVIQEAAYADKPFIKLIIACGANFNDLATQLVMMTHECHKNHGLGPEGEKMRARASREPRMHQISNALLWLILHGAYNEELVPLLRILLDTTDLDKAVIYTAANGTREPFGKKIPALFQYLIFDEQEKAEHILEQLNQRCLFGYCLFSSETIELINQALQLVAARGNKKVFVFILDKLKNVLDDNKIQKSFMRATLAGHHDILVSMEELIRGLQWKYILNKALKLAVTQRHVPIVKYLFYLDEKLQLGIEVVPAAERVEILLRNQRLPEQVRQAYTEILKIIQQHLQKRSLQRMVLLSSQDNNLQQLPLVVWQHIAGL